MITIICAMGTNRAIGRGNTLLWKLPGDLKRFKSLTMGHPMIMGRKTYESIGRALPGRTTIILTRNAAFNAAGCLMAGSFKDALALAEKAPGGDDVFVIGGGQIYEQALARAGRLCLTQVEDTPEGADTFFPVYDGFTVKTSGEPQTDNGIKYHYVELVRNR